MLRFTHRNKFGNIAENTFSLFCRNKLCGKLYCRGTISVVGIRVSLVRDGCYVVNLDDQGYVPNGLICGQSRVNISVLPYF